MPIKSLEELRKIREEHQDRVNLRASGNESGDQIEILIGMATCGISSGARETLNAFRAEIISEKLENITVVPVGCIGYCHSEPTIQVSMPGQKPVLYGKVKKEAVHQIFEQHIKNGKPVEHMILKADFERV